MGVIYQQRQRTVLVNVPLRIIGHRLAGRQPSPRSSVSDTVLFQIPAFLVGMRNGEQRYPMHVLCSSFYGMAMHAQLQSIIDGLHGATARLHRLVETVPAAKWPERAEPERWSVSECIEHLNLTSTAYIPIIEAGLGEARQRNVAAPARYRRDLIGWLLWRTMDPPILFRVKTMTPFIPAATAPPDDLLHEFERLQAEQIALAEAADGLPLQAVRIPSPFDPRLTYNLYSCLSLLHPHQHRHLWQAEQVHTTRDHRR
jgi:hypothetical protein